MSVGQPPAVFPGGMEIAPELTPARCGHDACLCHLEPGKRFCALACARGHSDDGGCTCGHFGCSYHRA